MCGCNGQGLESEISRKFVGGWRSAEVFPLDIIDLRLVYSVIARLKVITRSPANENVHMSFTCLVMEIFSSFGSHLYRGTIRTLCHANERYRFGGEARRSADMSLNCYTDSDINHKPKVQKHKN